MTQWQPTRQAALERLRSFVPSAGRAYAGTRNSDHGPQDRSNVSALSPYIRRRMITEEEVVAAVLKQHSFAAAEKFIQEVAWRTYWKGWLEMRPAMLTRFNAERIALKAQMESDRSLARRYVQATEGSTGIACFDAWVDELREFGWLHNHARMWFASIWIFTLGLPWQLGADFFYKHLLDADPASNTLSWRWVAGLHTAGKHYLARAENIERNTGGRFAPYGELNERALALSEDAALLPITPIAPVPHYAGGRCAVLLTEEDLHPESWPESFSVKAEVLAIAVLPSATVHAADGPAAAFSAAALQDAAARAAQFLDAPATFVDASAIQEWLAQNNVQALVTAQAPVSMVAWQIETISAALQAQGAQLIQLRRAWDDLLWPRATAGFFKLKTALPDVIARLDLVR
jgi:deoxyribodipyrimidine photo-lyase